MELVLFSDALHPCFNLSSSFNLIKDLHISFHSLQVKMCYCIISKCLQEATVLLFRCFSQSARQS